MIHVAGAVPVGVAINPTTFDLDLDLGGWQRGLGDRRNQGCSPHTLLIKAAFISS
jgi:hypothetical protein